MPFPLERLVLWNPKVELTNSDDHLNPSLLSIHGV